MDSLFLLDAYALIYRSYFAFLAKPLRNPKGQNVSAAFGFFRSVFQLWDQYQPKAMAAVFDSRTPTFRHTMYEQYKATRQKTPEDLYDQIPLVEEILKLLGVPLLRADGYEADDLIAALADRCKSENRPCYIVSGDKDLLQLVGGSVLALRPDKDTGWKCIGPSEVQAEWGVSPERILDYLSLTGDHSDNVPGVPGVGDKTAAKLMAQYGSFDAIWENIDTIKPDGVRAKLLAGKDSAFLSRKLITLDMDAPTGVQNLDALSVHSLNKDAASAVFMREGMRSLASRRVADGLDKLDSVAEHRSAAPMHSPVRGIVENSPPPGELFALPQTQKIPEHYSRAGNCELVRDAASLSRWVKNAKKAGTFAFDCETDSLDEMRELPVGFSLAVDDKGGCYVPLKAPEAGLINEDEARNILAPLLADKTLTVVGQNLKFDMHIMENWGCPIACTPWDTMIAAWLLDPERDSLKLEALGQSYLGFGGSPYAELGPKGTPFSSFELAKAAPYASEDAYLCMRLKALMEPLLAETGLLALFTDLEMPVLRVLASMERNGIMVDAAQLFAFGSELDKELAQVQEETYKLVGHEFNLNSPKQLQEVLFVERKLASGKKTKTGYSTDISVLEELAREDPVPQLILRHRTMQKLKSTYVDALVELANKDPRIHTHFVQTGAATGRLSSRDPNLQNIPVREEEGRRIRAAFVAQKGYTLISADYSQIELVVFAHLSDDPELKK
ncbi:MAG TPA: DNA polymerase I, partial [Spirochaetales bacterium]|nr:DNA polymerase I [Spirochaetales bacterium]